MTHGRPQPGLPTASIEPKYGEASAGVARQHSGQPLIESSTTWVTYQGSSDIGECPQPLSETCRAPGRRRAALSALYGGVIRSRVPQPTVTGTGTSGVKARSR